MNRYYQHPDDKQAVYVTESQQRGTDLYRLGWKRITRTEAVSSLGGARLFSEGLERCKHGAIENTGNRCVCVRHARGG